MKLKTSMFILLAVAIFSCNKFKVNTLEDGTRMQIHQSGNSDKYAKEGDYLTFDLEIKTASDSIVNSTYIDKRPIFIPAQKGIFAGSFENALFHIAEGDSVTVFVNADSLFRVLGQPVPPEVGKGSDIRFVTKMRKIQTQEDIDKELAEERKAEDAIIEEFVNKNMAGAKKTAEGIYYLENKPGTGELIREGNTATVHYVGTFMDGTSFDSGEIPVKIGEKRVIPGWEIALKTMRKGGASKFIIPSKEAYGNRGAGPIAPNTPLVFEITVNDVK